MKDRTVTACVTLGEEWLGAIGPFPTAVPRWSAVGPVAEEVRAVLGVPVLVLRLVRVDGGEGGRGGHVIYHVAALERPATLPRDPAPGDPAELLRPAECRAPWATEAGVRAALSWAEAALGPAAIGDVEQVKSWNLSGLFRLTTADGPRWLKMVPGFSAHEPSAIAAFAALDPGLVPELIAHAPGMMLLADAPGTDCGRAGPSLMRSFAGRFVTAQHALAPTARLRADGVPVRGVEWLGGAVEDLLGRVELAPGERRAVAELAAGIAEWGRRLAECGLPETLVHGDFHLMNWRSSGMVLDFADSQVGHPVLDGFRFGDFQPPERCAAARAAWAAAWSAAVPGCDPRRALEVAEPLCHLMYAVRYQEFLDNIEPAEHCYHESDVADQLRAAVSAARARR